MNRMFLNRQKSEWIIFFKSKKKYYKYTSNRLFTELRILNGHKISLGQTETQRFTQYFTGFFSGRIYDIHAPGDLHLRKITNFKST